MVYGIVERHGGAIEIESEPGQGTTFRFRLPAKTSDGAVASPSAAGLDESLRLVPTEDEEELRKIFGE
jgi:two-component system cell cycle sensor histidine kinase/response regulator CckA